MYDDSATNEQKGWRDANSTDHPITDAYVVLPGDQATFRRYRYFHGPCYKQFKAEQPLNEVSEEYRKLLEDVGFENIVIECKMVPESLIQLVFRAKNAVPSPEDVERTQNAWLYLHAKTDLGVFGLLQAGRYPMIDLSGTGVTLRDLHIPSEEMPNDFPLVPMMDKVIFLRLYIALTKLARKPKTPKRKRT